MRIRVETSVGDVAYYPCVYPFVGLDTNQHLFICKSMIKRYFYSDVPLDHLSFDFDWSEEVDFFGNPLQPPYCLN